MGCIRTYMMCYRFLVKPRPTWTFDLQLFSGEKTEDPTSKRKADSRQKGQVAKSMELNATLGLLAALFALQGLGTHIFQELSFYMRICFENLAMNDMTIEMVSQLFIGGIWVLFKAAMPVMAILLIVSVATNILQVGFMFSLEVLEPSLEKLNPIAGFGRMFSVRSLAELAKSLFKVTVVCAFIYRFLLKEADKIPALITVELADAIVMISNLLLSLCFQICGVFLFFAGIDYVYQLWQHNQSLKMSKDEVKQEYKQMEGDPLIKGKIKEKQRMMAMRRMMQEVPTADVVVTNPTHYAVALKYDKTMVAPVVVAKGQDLIAQRIKEIAKDNKVMVMENKPLARALYAMASIGDVVPPELYQAVAEVLAYVYRLKHKLS